MSKQIFNFELANERILVIEAVVGAWGANERIGKVLDISGATNNDLIVLMEDDNSIWNIGDANKVDYDLLEKEIRE